MPFSELGETARHYAERLVGIGAGPKTVIALMGPTDERIAAAVIAVWLTGATLTVLPTPTRLGNLEQFLCETLEKIRRSEASLLVGEEGAVSVFKELAGIPVLSWEELDSGQEPLELAEAKLGGCKPALIQFSSGTTREPQPILLSEQALLNNSRAVLDCFPGGAQNHSCVSWLPLYHDMGLIGCFLMPLLAPGHLTLMGPEVFAVRPFTWLEAISEQKATTSSAPNFALAYCADRLSDSEIANLDLSSWQIAMVGAETVRPKTLRRFARRFEPQGFNKNAFSPVYGLAEATLAVTFSPLGEGLKTLAFDPEEMATSGTFKTGERETASLGKPLVGVELSIRHEGTPLGEDQLGEVWVKSPSLMMGLLDEGEVRTTLCEGWLETGDAGFLHQGELYLYGRRRDILLLDGRNHDPSVVEAAAEALDSLRRCCAFVLEVDSEEKDELVLCCEVANSWSGEPESFKEQIRSQCRREANLVPDRVVLLPSGDLPVTSSGKLRRAVACRMFQEGSLRSLSVAPV
jgi:acyl-CoA synthetase (AMP-forming)/AMP-acid ligase II